MTGEQRAVLWIGILLVSLNLVMKWSDIRAIIFTGSGASAPSSGSDSSGGGGGLQIPNPLHQFPGGTFLPPTIHVPV
jgi:hypothetical protein